MNVFELRDRLVDDYRQYIHSFIKIRDQRIKEFVDGHLGSEGFWPEPLLQRATAHSNSAGSVAAAIYDDRLEVTSSGPLHFGLTPEGLFEPHESLQSLPWNPLIARVFCWGERATDTPCARSFRC